MIEDYPYLDHNAPAIIEENVCAKGTSKKCNTQCNTGIEICGDMSRK